MIPIRVIQEATHFKSVMGPDRTDPLIEFEFLTPCSPGDPAAKEMNWLDIDPLQFLETPVCLKDLLSGLQRTRPSVSPQDLVKQQHFTDNFGQEG